MRSSKILATIGVTALAVGAASVAGCGGESRSGEPTKQAAARTAAPVAATATPPAVGPSRPLRFRATDGVRLRGTLFAGGGRRSPAVVLVHQSDGGPDQFKPFLPYLHAAGDAAMTYTSRPLPGRMDEAENARDIAGAIAALRRRPSVDPRRIAVVGASIGAAAAAHLSFTTVGRSLPAIVGLSPGITDEISRIAGHGVALLPDGRARHDVLAWLRARLER